MVKIRSSRKEFLIGAICICLLCTIPKIAHSAFLVGKIKENGINVRVDSTVSSLSLGILRKGEMVNIVKKKYNWYKIIIPRRFTFYAYSGYLDRFNINSAKVKANILNIRSGPSTDYPVIGRVKKGIILQVITKKGDWASVRGFPYAYGWIHGKFLDITAPNINHKRIDTKKENIAVSKNNTAVPNNENRERYDYFMVKGSLYKLIPMDNCPANYKLQNGLATFFLEITGVKNINNFLRKRVVVKGKRFYGKCSYIHVDNIAISE